MKIVAVAAGSWGDILPFIPPARELGARGHDVVFAVPPLFARVLRRFGLRSAPVGPFPRKESLLALHASVGTDDTGAAPLAEYWLNVLLRDATATYESLLPLIEDADAALVHYHSIAAHAAANRAGVPRASLAWGPACIPSRGYVAPLRGMQVPDLGATLDPAAGDDNEAGWVEDTAWARRVLDPASHEVMKALGLDLVDAAPFSLPATADRLLLASHRCLVPDQPDWPANAVQVGYPYCDSVPGTSAAAASDFVTAGRPPALVSFGTAIAGGAGDSYATVVRVLRAAGYRVLLLGPKTLTVDPDDDGVLHVEFLPISEVVGSCSLFVHHGGPGSTIAGLRAGVPGVAVPQFLDQPLNAAIVAARRAGAALRPRELADDRLAKLVAAAASSVDGAAALAKALADDPDPAAVIADEVERLAR